MKISRREFIQLLAVASAGGLIDPKRPAAANADMNYYDVPRFGNVSLLHITDCHAQLLPCYYREPAIHLGVGDSMANKIPHLVGDYFLEKFNIPKHSRDAHALTFLDFTELAIKYGRTGGFAHLATMVKQLRAERPGSLLLDGGDTWQGSATSLWTNAQDMIDASKILGVDVMTGHWEFTYGHDRLMHVLENDLAGKIDFVAQNVVDLEFEDPIFKPYVIKEINKVPVAIIGQAFPYTPIAHPKHVIPPWRFGINETRLHEIIEEARNDGAQIIVLLSHNGMDVDLKLAKKVSGIDVILGGHTHDAIPVAVPVKNKSGKTLVINSGTNGKFLSLLDMDVRDGKLKDYRYQLVPVFSNLIKPDAKMASHIERIRKPYLNKLNEKIAVTDDLLFRRGTFNGTFDQLILDALIERKDAEIAFSPGFRWGTSLLPGETISFEDVMAQTAITYPITTRNPMSGKQIKAVLEDLADNRFSHDPYMQQGGDMVRVGGMQYSIDLSEKIGNRIQNMTINGKRIDAKKKYVVAGWASMARLDKGTPIWDVVADHLRDKKTVRITRLNLPKVKAAGPNKGMQIVS